MPVLHRGCAANASGNAIGRGYPVPGDIAWRSHQGGGISIGGAPEYPGKVAKAPVRPNKADRVPAIAQPINVSTTRGNATQSLRPEVKAE